MATKPGIPKGTRDFSPVEMAKRNPRRLRFVWFSANRDTCHGEPLHVDGQIRRGGR